MTAAASRAELAAIGRDLIALEIGQGARRSAAFLDRLAAPSAAHPITPTPRFADLRSVPDWMRCPREHQTKIAHAAALASLAPLLAASIDGEWLGGLAKVAGEDLVDWAIDLPDASGEASVAPVDPALLAAHGFGLLRASLPPVLHTYLSWAPGSVSAADADDRARWTGAALGAFDTP